MKTNEYMGTLNIVTTAKTIENYWESFSKERQEISYFLPELILDAIVGDLGALRLLTDRQHQLSFSNQDIMQKNSISIISGEMEIMIKMDDAIHYSITITKIEKPLQNNYRVTITNHNRQHKLIEPMLEHMDNTSNYNQNKRHPR